MFEMLDEGPRPTRPTQYVPQVKGHITFENVTFGYDPYFPVIRDLNLDIKPVR